MAHVFGTEFGSPFYCTPLKLQTYRRLISLPLTNAFLHLFWKTTQWYLAQLSLNAAWYPLKIHHEWPLLLYVTEWIKFVVLCCCKNVSVIIVYLQCTYIYTLNTSWWYFYIGYTVLFILPFKCNKKVIREDSNDDKLRYYILGALSTLKQKTVTYKLVLVTCDIMSI